MNISTRSRKNWYHQNWRWFVLGTLFLSTFLSYFDRQTLGTAIDPISKEFGLDNIKIGQLLSAFLISYGWMHLIIGLITDRVRNIRFFFPLMVIGWSVSTMLVGFVKDYSSLVWLRYLLGIWEAVNFPICIMIISRIFRPEERSLAVGIFASGAFLATLAAPPFVVFLSNAYDWRYSFIIAGAAGFLWLIPWLIIFHKPNERSEGWDNYIKKVIGIKSFSGSIKEILSDYKTVLLSPGFWGVTLIGLGIIPSLYFASQWFPHFFTQTMNVPFDHTLSIKLSIIYFMQDIGLWIGGLLVLLLTKKGFSILNSRKVVIFIASLMMASVFMVPSLKSVHTTVIVLCIYVFGIGAFWGNQHAFKQDVVKGKVATVAALVGFIEMNFTSLIIKKIGFITNGTGDFGPVFYLMGALAIFAFLVTMFFIRPKYINIQ
jgi:MFS transporter, ACS family, hexuronate transporter